jgi:hypothetical protein
MNMRYFGYAVFDIYGDLEETGDLYIENVDGLDAFIRWFYNVCERSSEGYRFTFTEDSLNAAMFRYKGLNYGMLKKLLAARGMELYKKDEEGLKDWGHEKILYSYSIVRKDEYDGMHSLFSK